MLTKYLTSLAVIAIVATSIALGFAGTATATHDATIQTKVKNIGQGSDDTIGLSGVRLGQVFHTGTHSPGYTLSSVKIKSEDTEGDDFTVSLCATRSGSPTDWCDRLTSPSSYTPESGIYVSSNGTFNLAPNTDYAIVLTRIGGGSVNIDATTSDNEDSGAAAGWSIGNVHHVRFSLTQWVSTNTDVMRIAILARELPGDNANLTSFGITGATLSKTFNSNVENYRTDVVANAVTQITLNPTKSVSDASLRYLDADNTELVDADMTANHFQVAIPPGDTVVKVVVTAEDGTTTKTYTLAVLRAVLTTEEVLGCGSRVNRCLVTLDGDIPVYGTIDSAGDDDWMGVGLQSGTTYTAYVHQGRHLGADRLRCRTLDVYGPNNTRVGGFKSGIAGISNSGPFTHRFTPSTTGLHRFNVTGSCYKPNGPSSNVPDTGSYKVTVVSSAVALSDSETTATGDLPATTDTDGALTASSSVTGRLSSGTDSDWYQIHVRSNMIYRFPTDGLEYVVVMNQSGNRVWDNERSFLFGGESYFRPSTTGAYYVVANGFGRAAHNYEIEIEPAHAFSEQVELQPLTAAFVAMPLEHDGTAFTFQVEFSDDITATADELRQHGFTVNGGSVTSVAQVDDRAERSGTLPSRQPATTMCQSFERRTNLEQTGAICTSEGSALTTGIGGFVVGPPDRLGGQR